MKAASILILLFTFTTTLSFAQVTLYGGILKSEIKPRNSPPPPPPPNPAEADTNKVKVNIWPSPAPDDFHLLVKSPVDEKIDVNVYDLSGRAILRFEARDDESLAFGITLQPALYLVHIKQGLFEEVFKVVKQ